MRTGFIKYLGCALLAFIQFADSYAENDEIRYQHASLTQLMIDHPMYNFNEEIADAFKELPVNDRFNDHGLGVKVVKFATQEYTDQTKYINSFIEKSKIGSRAVAKWFGWNKKDGSFNVDLVKSRGVYNANEFDRQIASMLVRGSSILEDAGENLLPYTFLIVHDICYKGNYSNRKADFDKTGKKVSFDVEVTSYIYSLDWNVDSLDSFYGRYYTTGNTDFIRDAAYGYTFKDKVSSRYSESSDKLTHRQLIKQVVARCLDINIATLQTSYPDFRIRTPLRSTTPLLADIGLKEGITINTYFEVLERELDENGIATYTRKGIIKPKEGKIVDNRFNAIEDNVLKHEFTEFEIVKGKDFSEGLFIRECTNF